MVVDNASTDGTQKRLASSKVSRFCVLQNAQNLGGAGDFEQGARVAVGRCDPDWIVLMDDDARPRTETLARFMLRIAMARRLGRAWFITPMVAFQNA